MTNFSDYQTQGRAQGADEVLERQWAANTVIGTHTHAFGARALVVQGEMWLTVGDKTQHLRSGDRFELAPEVPHDEHYGPEGATYWVARFNGPM